MRTARIRTWSPATLYPSLNHTNQLGLRITCELMFDQRILGVSALDLSVGQYTFVYNAFSFTLIAMSAATVFLWLGRSQVTSSYKTALSISGLVTAIAAYHYFRIFGSWEAAHSVRNNVITSTGLDPMTAASLNGSNLRCWP